MWPNHHSSTVSTPNPSSTLWGDGSSTQNFTKYPVNAKYQYPQTFHNWFRPFMTNLTPNFSETMAEPGDPVITSAAADYRVLASVQPDPATNEPQRVETTFQPDRVRKRKRGLQSPRYSASDWERQRSAIKELYIVRDLSLEQTIEEMSKHGFKPPVKKYKEKLKEWRFVKYVPREVVQWMFHKAEQRRRPNLGNATGKATHFEYGEATLTMDDVRKRFQRANLNMGDVVDLDAPTPQDVVYKTPCDMASSPPTPRSPGQGNSVGMRWTPAPSPQLSQVRCLPPTFNNQTLADFEKIAREAQNLERVGGIDAAEEMYRQALAGFENILSPTHDRTNTVAYHLASFYANCYRMDDADRVLNWTAEKHIERWGVDHENTTRHFLRVSKLYNSWSRNDEALSLLYRVLDTWDKPSCGNMNGCDPIRLGAPQNTTFPRATLQGHGQLLGSSQTSNPWAETDNPVQVDYQLGVVKSRLESGDDTAEEILLLLIDQCESHRQMLSLQIIRARCTLIDLYRRQGQDEKSSLALEKAREVVDEILKPRIEKTEALLETCVGIGKLHLQAHRDETADEIFQSIAAEAEDDFEMDRSFTTTILITIGQIYQSENGWSKAEPWFERALAASMAANNLDSRLTKALAAALEDRHYSSSTCLTGQGHLTFLPLTKNCGGSSL